MDQDPFFWSVLEVAHFFRNHAAGYVSGIPHSVFPDLEQLAQSMEVNDVSGAVLLSAVETSFLRDDCGIKSLGMRSSVIQCISRLRQQSRGYGQENGEPMLAASVTPMALSAPVTPHLLSSPAQKLDTNGDVGGNVRKGETRVEDPHGRKRRKLDLSTVVQQSWAHDALYFVTQESTSCDWWRARCPKMTVVQSACAHYELLGAGMTKNVAEVVGKHYEHVL